eukprot:3859371-Rhodomonas_salina.1
MSGTDDSVSGFWSALGAGRACDCHRDCGAMVPGQLITSLVAHGTCRHTEMGVLVSLVPVCTHLGTISVRISVPVYTHLSTVSSVPDIA